MAPSGKGENNGGCTTVGTSAEVTSVSRAGVSRPDPPDSIPVPGAVGTAGVVARTVRDDITGGLSYLREEYGRTVWLDLPGSFVRGIVVSQPRHVEQILATDEDYFRKPDEYIDLLQHQGKGLTTSRGAAWQEQNQILNPLFQRDSVHSFTDVVVARTETLLDRWQSVADLGGTIALREELGRLSLSILGRTLFSTDMDEYAADIRRGLAAIRTWRNRQQSPVPFPSWFLDRQVRGPVDRLRRLFREFIRDRRGIESEYDDLLSMMMLADAGGAGMSDERIVDNIITFLVGGHETTAIALTWTLSLLAQHPDTYRRLHESVPAALVSTEHTITPETVDDLQATSRALQEGMRIYPPVPFFAREATEDVHLGDHRVSRGTVVIPCPFLTHRDPDIWDDPLAYRPARFRKDHGESRPRYSFYPFGGGQRMCIGRQFALMEAQLILGLVTAAFRLELESPDWDDVGVSTSATMVPDTELEMSVQGWGD